MANDLEDDSRALVIVTEPNRRSSMDNFKQLSWKDVDIKEILGTGAFNQVHAVSLKDPEEDSNSGSLQSQEGPYAIKCIQRKVARRASNEELKDIKKDLETEGHLLAKLRGHPNIVYLHCLSENVCKDRGRFLLLERLHGTVEDSIQRWKAERSSWSDEKKMSHVRHRHQLIAGPVASAMDHLHSQSIVYRDLKPENIGFDASGTVKLFDFGLARELPFNSNGELRRMTSGSGTFRYMSPECYKGEVYGLPTDVYSFGLLLWEIASLKKPYAKMDLNDLTDFVFWGDKRPKLIAKCGSLEMRKLMKDCWDATPAVRPTFAEIRSRLAKDFSSEPPKPSQFRRMMRRCTM